MQTYQSVYCRLLFALMFKAQYIETYFYAKVMYTAMYTVFSKQVTSRCCEIPMKSHSLKFMQHRDHTHPRCKVKPHG